MIYKFSLMFQITLGNQNTNIILLYYKEPFEWKLVYLVYKRLSHKKNILERQFTHNNGLQIRLCSEWKYFLFHCYHRIKRQKANKLRSCLRMEVDKRFLEMLRSIEFLIWFMSFPDISRKSLMQKFMNIYIVAAK